MKNVNVTTDKFEAIIENMISAEVRRAVEDVLKQNNFNCCYVDVVRIWVSEEAWDSGISFLADAEFEDYTHDEPKLAEVGGVVNEDGQIRIGRISIDSSAL